MTSDLPTIEKSVPLASPGYVDVTFASTNTGSYSEEANTAGATTGLLGDGKTVRVTLAGPTNYGHVDLKFIESGSLEVGRARVVFLVPVTFN